MFTTCPSPLVPPTMAVTTTRVSLATKFRIHRWYLALLPGWEARSNLRDHDNCRRVIHNIAAKREERDGEENIFTVVRY